MFCVGALISDCYSHSHGIITNAGRVGLPRKLCDQAIKRLCVCVRCADIVGVFGVYDVFTPENIMSFQFHR